MKPQEFLEFVKEQPEHLISFYYKMITKVQKKGVKKETFLTEISAMWDIVEINEQPKTYR